MAYQPALHKIQIGREAVINTPVAGSIQPPGITNVRITPKVEAMQLIDKRGTTMPAHEAFVKRRWSEGVIEGYLNYKEAYLWLDGMFGEATPAAGVYSYLASLDWAAETEKSLTLLYGQTGLLYRVAGVLPSELVLKGASGEPITFSYSFFGQPVSDGASFASLSDDVVTWAMSTDTELYMDAGLGATVGTTPLADVAFSFNASVTADRAAVWHLGDQAHDSYKRGKWGGSLSLVLEGTATTLGYLGDVIDNTDTPESYAIRLRTTNASDILDLDFVGTVIAPPVIITDSDGVVTVEMELVPQYGTDLVSCWAAELTVA